MQASEQAVVKAHQLQSHGTVAQRDSAGALSLGRLSAPQSGGGTNSCYRCGKSDHTLAACRLKAARCHNCNKIGHIAVVCRKKWQGSPKATQGRGRQPPGPRGIKSVREGEEVQPTEQLGLKIIRCEQGKPLGMNLTLNGQPLTMELDTGAAVSLVSERVWQKLLPDCKPRPSALPLRTYSGEPVSVLRVVDVDVTYGMQHATQPLHVVKGIGPSLFGRNWLEAICPEWESIETVLSIAVSIE